MKIVKSLVLSSTAALAAIGGAQAADLPVKAKAVEYVRVCSLYGAGFWYIPGTDTCIKLGGYVRVDTTFNGQLFGGPYWSGDGGQQNRYADNFFGRSRFALTVDVRTATDYGVVREYTQVDFNFNNFGTANSAAASFGFALPLGLNPTDLMGVGGGAIGVEHVYLQFAGFTFGKSISAYASPWNGYPGNNTASLVGGHDSVTGVNNVQYTAQFGNGVSGSVGLDDPTVYNRTGILNLSLASTSGVSAGGGGLGGTHSPDIVGNIRVDQAWGLFQISAAAHEVDASYNVLGAQGAPNNLSEISGHPDTKWGGSVMAALQIKNLPTGAGDDIKMDVSYAKGDSKNVLGTSAPTTSFAMYGNSNRGYQSIGFGQTADAVYAPVGLALGGGGLAGVGGTGDLKLVEAYGFRAGYNHNWDPHWSSGFWGSAAAFRYPGTVGDLTTAKGQWCASYIAANALGTAARPVSADFRCNPDYTVYMAGVVTRWTPVKNLTFSAELGWMHLDQNFAGTATLGPTAPKPVAVYEFKDQNTAYLNVRVQRNF